MALSQLKDKLMLLKRGVKSWCMVPSLPPCPMQLLSQVMTIIYDCHGRHGGDAPHAFWVDEPRGKGVSGMQAERASVNGCKLQRGGDKCPASVLNELRLKEDKVSNRLKALDIASIIYKMNAKTGYL